MSGGMVEDKYAVRSKIFEIGVLHRTLRSQASQEELKTWGPHVLQVSMSGLYFGEGNKDDPVVRHPRTGAEVGMNGYDIITLYMNKETANAQGIDWDGTIQSADRLNKELKDKYLILNQGLEQVVNSTR